MSWSPLPMPRPSSPNAGEVVPLTSASSQQLGGSGDSVPRGSINGRFPLMASSDSSPSSSALSLCAPLAPVSVCTAKGAALSAGSWGQHFGSQREEVTPLGTARTQFGRSPTLTSFANGPRSHQGSPRELSGGSGACLPSPPPPVLTLASGSSTPTSSPVAVSGAEPFPGSIRILDVSAFSRSLSKPLHSSTVVSAATSPCSAQTSQTASKSTCQE